MKSIYSYRKLIASFLACWMSAIIVSGILFIHKEVTSTGEIVIHVHPYDFTKKKEKHHKTDADIHFLDIVYHGSFLEASFTTFTEPVFKAFTFTYYGAEHDYFHSRTHESYYLRGPPTSLYS